MNFIEEELKEHFSEVGSLHLENLPPSDYYPKMIELIKMCNYLQILYGMGYVYLLILMDFFEKREDYGQCARILATIHNHNKISGDNLKQKL